MKYIVLIFLGILVFSLISKFIQQSPGSTKRNINFDKPNHLDSTAVSNDPVVVAAGDIACASLEEGISECNQGLTSRLVQAINPTAVLTLGDLQYPVSSYENLVNYFDKSWGMFKSKIKPAVGNHEYSVPLAKGYFDYFNGIDKKNGAAGDRDKGYYSFEIGQWQIVSINSNCWAIGGCNSDSKQYQWVQEELKKNPRKCQIAYFHHPLYSSGMHGNNSEMKPLFALLDSSGVDIVLNGHDHTYERLSKINSEGSQDEKGIRVFIVGTGGRSLYRFLNPLSFSEVKQNQEFGVLKLTLHPESYDFEFVSIKQDGFVDKGSDVCI